MNKLQTLEEAVACLKDGMTIGVGGWGPRRKPMALIRAILRSDVKDLTVVSYGGADVGMLVAAGKVKKLLFAFVSLDFIPLEPWFRKARQAGELDVWEMDEGMMLLGLRAAAMGAPFIPTKVGLGTDALRASELKVIDSPYDDKEWVAMPALNLDVALVHVDKADERGVCQINGPDHYMDDWFVRAAKHSVVSCDELVDTEYFHTNAEHAHKVFWERSQTGAVVHAKGGAHPSSCAPLYGFDVKHFKQYSALAKEENGWQSYMTEFVVGGEEAYLETVGGLDKVTSLPVPVY